MVAVIPKIQVYNKKNPVVPTPGMAGRIAVIGAFDSEETNPVFCADLDVAYELLGDDVTYNGCKVLDKLFYGADGVLAVNITTKDGDTVHKDITTANLTSALAKIKKERFDMLFIADILTDAFLPILTGFSSERYLNKLPIGYVICVTGANAQAYTTTAGLIDDACYGLISNQPAIIKTSTYDLLETTAHYCGVIASTNIGASMTQKQVPDMTGLVTEYTFENNDLGKVLVGLGYTVFNCYDRENNIYEVVNSEQPNGYDLYVNRVRDYVIREFALHDFLGERNRTKTYSEIKQEISRVKDKCVNTLDLLEDIEYNIVKKSVNCVDINITKLLFAGIITEIDVYITIEVE